MSRRPVHLAEELPPRAKRLLRSIGVDLYEVQAWLDANKWDGCTIAPDLYLVVCGWHDWACRASDLPRWVCDGIAADLIRHVAAKSQDEAPWRRCGRIWASLFWVGLRLGAAFRIGRRQ